MELAGDRMGRNLIVVVGFAFDCSTSKDRKNGVELMNKEEEILISLTYCSMRDGVVHK